MTIITKDLIVANDRRTLISLSTCNTIFQIWLYPIEKWVKCWQFNSLCYKFSRGCNGLVADYGVLESDLLRANLTLSHDIATRLHDSYNSSRNSSWKHNCRFRWRARGCYRWILIEICCNSEMNERRRIIGNSHIAYSSSM